MSGRRKASEPVAIQLLPPRRIPMNADEEDRAVAALVAVLVEANRTADLRRCHSDDSPTAA